MFCFNHQKEAVAICKHCGKCLCHECVTMVDGGAACSEVCEQKVQEYMAYIELSKQGILKVSSTFKRTAAFLFILGTLFIFMGVGPFLYTGDVYSLFLSLMGLPFILAGYHNLKSAKQIKTNEKA